MINPRSYKMAERAANHNVNIFQGIKIVHAKTEHPMNLKYFMQLHLKFSFLRSDGKYYADFRKQSK